MAMGTPAAVYNGGLLQAHVRYFDPRRRRPGLPEYVAALAHRVAGDGVHLELVNTDPVEAHMVLIQSGSFAEHEFTGARLEDEAGEDQHLEVNDRYLQVHLGPAARAHLHLGLTRFAHRPSYEFPPFD